MKTIFRTVIAALAILPLAFGAQPKNIQKTDAGLLTGGFNSSEAHTFLSGASVTFDAGSTLTVNGIFNGTPTGGTLDLSAVTVTGVSGGGGGGTWGSITGTLSNQTDLNTALGLKLSVATAASTYQPLAAVLTNTTAAFTTAQETKLSGIATGATANASDAQLRDRSTHTGTQAISTITGLQAAIDAGATFASLIAVNPSGVNVGGKVDWSQLMNVPAGFADGTDDGAGGGSGTVTSFSAGDLSPLFTTSEATPTSTPALTFTLSSAAQNTVFAGPTSGTGAPSYRALVPGDLPALTGGDATTTAGSGAITLGTVNANVGTFGNATTVPAITVDAKGRVTGVSNVTISAGSGNISGAISSTGNIVATNGAGSIGETGVTITSNNIVTSGNVTANVGTFTTGNFATLDIGTLNVTSLGSTIVPGASGGTGVNNSGKTITLGGNVTMSGAYTFTGTLTGNTSVTYPTSGTLANTTYVDDAVAAGGGGGVPSGVGDLWPTANIASPPTGYFAAGEYGTTANTALGDWSIIVKSAGTVADPTPSTPSGAVAAGTVITLSSAT